MSSEIIQNNFLISVRNYIGIKFRHQGRSRLGVDCIGLVICAAKDIGYDLEPGILNYAPNPGMSFLNGIKETIFIEEIERNQMVNGDLYLINHMHMPIHVAIKNYNCIIHAYQPIGWVAEHLLEYKFEKRFHSFWRINWDKAPRIV